jgi:hypothetical protein
LLWKPVEGREAWQPPPPSRIKFFRQEVLGRSNSLLSFEPHRRPTFREATQRHTDSKVMSYASKMREGSKLTDIDEYTNS